MHSDGSRWDSNSNPKANSSQSLMPKATLDPTVSHSVRGYRPSIPDEGFGGCDEKHRAKEITEGGEGKSGKEHVDGRGGREEAVNEVIERVRLDPELGEHEWMSLWCTIDPRKSNPLSVDCLSFEPSHRDIKRYLWESAPPPVDRLFYQLFPCRSSTCSHSSSILK